MKKIIRPWIVALISIGVSVSIYFIVAIIFTMENFVFGISISAIIPAIVAYPISNVIYKSHKKINSQKIEIEKSHEKIQHSINYASRIQQALLPEDSFLSENFSSHFIFNKPKDIVSGDFYYLKKKNEFIIIAVADCTGHGVPGAFVSMLGISFLNEIINENKVENAAKILEELRIKVKTSLKQTDKKNSNKDGMDIALCVLDTKTMQLSFSGANNPLFIVKENSFEEFKATRNPIGIHPKELPFKNNEIQLQKQDKIYMFSDGYTDQFGGEKGMKFYKNNFKELLIRNSTNSLSEQKIVLSETLKNWQGAKYKQTDDILIVGIEV
jgi:serine phosphatase RsbU (regulator of sigma subunit)